MVKNLQKCINVSSTELSMHLCIGCICSVFASILYCELCHQCVITYCNQVQSKVKNLHMQSVIEPITLRPLFWSLTSVFVSVLFICFEFWLYLCCACICICVVIVLYLCCNLHMQSVMEPITPGPLPWSLTSVDGPGHLPRPNHASSQQGNLGGFPLHWTRVFNFCHFHLFSLPWPLKVTPKM